MSIKYMSTVWEHSQHSGNNLLILLALADHANDDGLCWPSIPSLAKKARISERQAKRIIQSLVDSGEIEIIKRGDGRGHSTLYLLKGDIIVSPFNSINSDIAMSPFSEIDINRKGDKSCIKGDIAMSPEPPIEPSLEPPLQQDETPEPSNAGSSGRRQTDTDYAAICNAIEQNGFGMMTPLIADKINSMLEDYPTAWILDAMKESVTQNKRKLSYVCGILNNWRADGREERKPDSKPVPVWQKYGGDVPDYMKEIAQ